MIPIVYNYPLCDECHEPNVDIYHDSGDYCLMCWVKKTTPYITPVPDKIDRCVSS